MAISESVASFRIACRTLALVSCSWHELDLSRPLRRRRRRSRPVIDASAGASGLSAEQRGGETSDDGKESLECSLHVGWHLSSSFKPRNGVSTDSRDRRWTPGTCMLGTKLAPPLPRRTAAAEATQHRRVNDRPKA